jgi:Leucine-rich repeat (LRR) protein
MKTNSTPLSLAVLVMVLLNLIFLAHLALAEDAVIPDPGLKYYLQQALKDFDGTLMTESIASLVHLKIPAFDDDDTDDCSPNYFVKDLTGLEHAAKLERLDLPNNQINDISPLTGLTSLRVLDLDENPIGDFTPIATLTGLEELDLDNAALADLSPMAGFCSICSLCRFFCGSRRADGPSSWP